MKKDTVIIGGAAGMWGDSLTATPQLLATKKLDYLIYECLAEITMAIMTRAYMKSPELGYAIDIINPILSNNLKDIQQQGIKVITNGGGVNPHAAAKKLRELAEAQGIELKIAVVDGDDMVPKFDQLRDLPVKEMQSGELLCEKMISMNAYLGAWPIVAALDAGADIVITGRVADSCLVLAPLMHEFGWGLEDFDKLAQGSLAGHLLECGPQSTGGLMTDWQQSESWVNMGYPIAECSADGSFVLTKPELSDGIVNIASVSEQVIYEIGDPKAYLLPDVVANFSEVKLTDLGNHRVKVEGARGLPPTPYYKACAQVADGYRMTFLLMIGGRDAAKKGRRVAESILARASGLYKQLGFEDFRETSIEVMGAEDTYGPHSRMRDSREVILKFAAHHNSRDALNLLARETPSVGLGMAQGMCGGGGGRPKASPYIQLNSYLIPKELVEVKVSINDQPLALEPPSASIWQQPPASAPDSVSDQVSERNFSGVAVPLLSLAYGRSGDKGDFINVGICARSKDFLPLIAEQLTADYVRDYLAHLVEGRVERYPLPGFDTFNFLMYQALGGGGTASLRYDAQGKATAQMLLDITIMVPDEILTHPDFYAVDALGE